MFTSFIGLLVLERFSSTNAGCSCQMEHVVSLVYLAPSPLCPGVSVKVTCTTHHTCLLWCELFLLVERLRTV